MVCSFLLLPFSHSSMWPNVEIPANDSVGVCTNFPHLCLVLEYFPLGDLRRVLNQKPPLPVNLLVKIALDVAQGIFYLHERKIIHRGISLSLSFLLPPSLPPFSRPLPSQNSASPFHPGSPSSPFFPPSLSPFPFPSRITSICPPLWHFSLPPFLLDSLLLCYSFISIQIQKVNYYITSLPLAWCDD